MVGAHAASQRAAPWTQRLAETPPWSPLRLGVAAAASLIALFLGAEAALGRLDLVFSRPAGHLRGDFRLALGMILLLAYLPAAFAVAVRGARRAVEELAPALRCAPAERDAVIAQTGRFERAELRRAGLWGMLLMALVPLATNLTPWTYAFWLLPPEATVHRLLLLPIGWFAGRFTYAVLRESGRLSRIGRELVRVDLLDLRPVSPLARQGLRQSFLAAGLLALLALFLGDLDLAPGLFVVVAGGLLIGSAVSAVALALPVRGIHTAIALAKRAELDWCDDAIRRARAASDAPSRTGPGLADLVAYRGLVESVSEWPFDAPALRRFVLYLAIPLGGWLGGALVERLVDAAIG
jgi:hypothetical protein